MFLAPPLGTLNEASFIIGPNPRDWSETFSGITIVVTAELAASLILEWLFGIGPRILFLGEQNPVLLSDITIVPLLI